MKGLHLRILFHVEDFARSFQHAEFPAHESDQDLSRKPLDNLPPAKSFSSPSRLLPCDTTH